MTILTPRAEKHMLLPEPFSGDPKSFSKFKSSVQDIFEAHPSKYNSVQRKIEFIGALLIDGPLRWFEANRESDSSYWDSSNCLLRALGSMYGEESNLWCVSPDLVIMRENGRSCVGSDGKYQILGLAPEFNSAAFLSIWIGDDRPKMISTVICQNGASSPTLTPVPALLSTGATLNFVSQQLVDQLQLPVAPVVPIHVQFAAVSSTGIVTHQTHPLLLRIGAHEELTAFHVLPSLHMVPMVLGMPWMDAHRPDVNWRTMEVSFPRCKHKIQVSNEPSVQVSPSTANTSQSLPVALSKFADVFSETPAYALPEHGEHDFGIDLTSGTLPNPRPIRNLSRKESHLLAEYIRDSLAKGFIRRSSSPLAASVFFAPEKDGTMRFRTDYGALNAITVKKKVTLPSFDDILESLVCATVFTKLEIRDAFNLVRIRSGDEWKTAFHCQEGHFEHLVMPFGLVNASAHLQLMLEDIFSDMLFGHLFVYQDSLLIFSRNAKSHDKHVNAVLARIRKHNMRVNLAKCHFSVSQVEYLGYTMSAEGIALTPEKVSMIQNWKRPNSVKAVQKFLGFANFCRRFLAHYAGLIVPLTALTRKDAVFSWSESCETAFRAIKAAVVSAPALHPMFADLLFILDVKVTAVALSATLSQPASNADPTPLPGVIMSRKLSAAESKYDVHDRELFAIAWALTTWYKHLRFTSEPVIILCNHHNLAVFRKTMVLSQRQAQWADTLACFNIVVHGRSTSESH